MNLPELTSTDIAVLERQGYRAALRGEPIAWYERTAWRNGWWLGVYGVEGVI